MMSSNEHNHDIEKGGVVQRENYNPTSSNDPVSFTPYRSKIANPGPAGLFSFASTTFMLSLFNVNARGIHTPNVIIGMALFAGGLTQFMAGMWEFPRGNTFGATAFSSYGAFWMSYATIFIPGSGVLTAYSDQNEFNNALGIYLMIWCIVTVMFLLAVLRRNIAFSCLLTLLAVALLLLAVGAWTGMASVTRAGGGFGMATALIAYYVGVSELLSAEKKAIFRAPLGILS